MVPCVCECKNLGGILTCNGNVPIIKWTKTIYMYSQSLKEMKENDNAVRLRLPIELYANEVIMRYDVMTDAPP